MAPAQRKWPSLGVSLIQFAEQHRIARWLLCVRDVERIREGSPIAGGYKQRGVIIAP
jgi:hypothetical protein